MGSLCGAAGKASCKECGKSGSTGDKAALAGVVFLDKHLNAAATQWILWTVVLAPLAMSMCHSDPVDTC